MTENDQIIPANAHFKNRPFDRDTLVLQAYNINFLFVLASYVNNSDNEGVKQRIHTKFREDLIKVYNSKYDFFKVTPAGSLKSFVDAHFEEYLGKMYHSDNEPFIWFAFDKDTTTISALKAAFSGEATVETTELK